MTRPISWVYCRHFSTNWVSLERLGFHQSAREFVYRKVPWYPTYCGWLRNGWGELFSRYLRNTGTTMGLQWEKPINCRISLAHGPPPFLAVRISPEMWTLCGQKWRYHLGNFFFGSHLQTCRCHGWKWKLKITRNSHRKGSWRLDSMTCPAWTVAHVAQNVASRTRFESIVSRSLVLRFFQCFK